MQKNDWQLLKDQLEKAKELLRLHKSKEAVPVLQEILRRHPPNAQQLFDEAENLLRRAKQRKGIRKFRISLLLIFSVSALFIVLLSMLEVFSTRVELQLPVSELSFETSEPWSIHSLLTRTIGISHLAGLELEIQQADLAAEYDNQTGLPTAWKAIHTGPQLQISGMVDNWGIALEGEFLNLTELFIQPGALVNIARDESRRRQVRIRIADSAVRGSVDTGDTLFLTCDNCRLSARLPATGSTTKTLRLQSFDRQVRFADLARAIDITVEIPAAKTENQPLLLAQNINVRKIDFTRFVNKTKESTLAGSGDIYFAELDNKALSLREGDFLVLDGLQRFQIRKLELQDDLHVTLQGELRTLESGTEGFYYSRMPSWLEWLHTNQTVTLIIATLIPVFSTALAIAYRLRIIKEI